MRHVVMLLAALMLIPAASFASGAEEPTSQVALAQIGFRKTGLPIVETPLPINVAIARTTGRGPHAEMTVLQDLEKRTNVRMQWQDLPASGGAETFNLMLASGDYPEVFLRVPISDYDVVKYSSEGMFMPLENLVAEYAPILHKLFEENPDARRESTLPDGHLYSLPWYLQLRFREYRAGHLVNKTWLAKLGLAKPTTTDELYRVLKAFKERDPNGNGKADEIPLSVRANDTNNGIFDLYGSFGFVDENRHLEVRNGKVVFTLTRPEYRTAVKYFHRLYAEGLMDAESFTQNQNQFYAKLRAKEIIVGSLTAFLGNFELGSQERLEDHYDFVSPLKGPDGTQRWRRYNGVFTRHYFFITNKCKYPEVLMRWVNETNEEDTAIQLFYGPFGSHLRRNAQGKVEILPEGVKTRLLVTPHNEGPWGLRADFLENRLVLPADWALKFEQLKVYWPFITGKDEVYPWVYFGAAEYERVNALATDIVAYADKMNAKWITQGTVDQDWAEYEAQLNRMGLPELIKIYQAAYDSYAKN